MSRGSSALAFLSLVVCAMTAEGGEFPYRARVNAPQVDARSGPGDGFYATDPLREGDTVDVYREDPGGWCAIRPPKSSYSLVPVTRIEKLEDGVGRAADDNVAVHVGSNESASRDIIQVRLRRGETVEIKGQATDPGWLKIAPPAGEFRWVRTKWLDRAPAGLQSVASDSSTKEDDHGDDFRAAAKSTAETEADSARLATHNESGWKATAASEGGAGTGAAVGSAATAGSGTKFSGLYQEIIDLDIELSIVVSEEVGQWTLASLRKRAEEALGKATTAIERGRVRSVLAKIERFEDIQRRYTQPGVAVLTSATTAPAKPAVTALPATDSNRETRYDGVGRLMPLPPGRKGEPRYALVDQRGKYSTLISAAPGVNLLPYLDKRVGVQGVRSYLPVARKAHVSVQRVTVLPPPERAALADRPTGRRLR